MLSRTVWNAMMDRKPALVARCLGVADVIACVQFARKHDLVLCIKGGGHNIAGLATANDALMLDMSLMRGVWVNKERRIAHAQAGCLPGDVDRETQLYGLAAVLGFISLTGIAGLTLGGSFGYLTRRWGWTSDTVVGMDVVTADARFVRASNEENTDLFWGLRGGGGNFGVVTGIDYEHQEVGPEIVGGIVAWPAAEAAGVLELYRTLAAKAPPEVTLVTLMRLAPPAPWLPKEIHGKPIVAILSCCSGKPEEGEKIVSPIKSFGSPVADMLVRRPYAQLQKVLDATQPKGRRYYGKSEYLAHIEPALCEKFIEHASKIPSPHSAVIIFQIGGALNQREEDHSLVGNRDARFVLNIAGKSAMDAFAPGIGATYDFTDRFTLFANVHKGYSVPGPRANARENLEEETSIGYELGSRYYAPEQGFGTELVLFYTDFDNLIVIDNIGGAGSGVTENVGDVTSYGAEYVLAYDPGVQNQWPFRMPNRLAVTYTHARLDGPSQSTDPESIFRGGKDGARLPYIPDYQIHFTTGIEFDRFGIVADFTYVPETFTTASNVVRQVSPDGTPDARFGKTDSYFLVDVSAHYQVTDWAKLVAGVKNLGGEEYIISRHPLGPRNGAPRT